MQSGGQVIEDFETGALRWSSGESDAPYRETAHGHVTDQVHRGRGAEYLAIEAGVGSSVYYVHPLRPAPIISETAVELWVRSDRPGVQLFVRVALPRVRDPDTGNPKSVRLPGGSVRLAHHWETLRLENFAEQLQSVARNLRLELGRDVDTREAYVQSVELNVYGGPGTTRVWIDDLVLRGYMPEVRPIDGGNGAGGTGRSSTGPGRATPHPAVGRAAIPDRPPGGAGGAFDATIGSEAESEPPVVLNGTLLRVAGRPFYPRAIEYQGEPPELLRQLGFNTLWLREAPSIDFLRRVAELKLRVICPPPWPLQGEDGMDRRRRILGPEWNVVIAWDLGRRWTRADAVRLRGDAQHVRESDNLSSRPLIAWPETDLRDASRAVDILLMGREPCGTSLELTDYGVWLRTRPLLARPGTPIWHVVQTQPAPALLRQWELLGLDPSELDAIDPEQIRLLAYLSLAGGARALLFRSHSPLDSPDTATRRRAAALELVNKELDCIAPFLSGGQFVGMVESNVPQAVAALFRVDRGRLIAPLWLDRHAQYVTGQSSGESVSFVVPGVPDWTAYLLLPGSLEPIRANRVTGGVRVTLEEFGPTSLVVLTQDPLILKRVSQCASESGARMTELQRQLVHQRVELVRAVQRGAQIPLDAAADWLRTARVQLQWSDGFDATGVTTEAFLAALRARRPLQLVERETWRRATEDLPQPIASPAAVRFHTLPRHQSWWPRATGAAAAPNRLPAGDFEDPAVVPQAGWQHTLYPVEGVQAQAELTAASARQGRYGLRLEARATSSEQPKLLDTAPLVMTSPPVSVEAGAIVCIDGWIHIPRPITASVDGVMIVDSLGGPALAERLGETVGWHRFTLYRVAPESGTMVVHFVLTGLGEVSLDDVRVNVLPEK